MRRINEEVCMFFNATVSSMNEAFWGPSIMLLAVASLFMMMVI